MRVLGCLTTELYRSAARVRARLAHELQQEREVRAVADRVGREGGGATRRRQDAAARVPGPAQALELLEAMAAGGGAGGTGGGAGGGAGGAMTAGQRSRLERVRHVAATLEVAMLRLDALILVTADL